MVCDPASRVELYKASAAIEATFAVAPAGPWLQARNNTLRFDINPADIVSEEVLGDRQMRHGRKGVQNITGTWDAELTFDDHDTPLEVLMGSTFPTPFTQISGTTIAAVAATQEFTDSGSGFGSISVGDYIIVAGFVNAANNGVFYVTVAAAGAITVARGTTLVDEAVGPSVTIDQEIRMDNGTNEDTLSFEGLYADITKYLIFSGVGMNTLSLNFAVDQLVTASFGLIGASFGGVSGTSVGITAAGTDDPLASLAGTFQFGTNAIRMVSSSIDITNNQTLAADLGSDEACSIVPAKFGVSGTSTLRFTGTCADLLTAFDNEERFELRFPATGVNGEVMELVVYSARITQMPESDSEGTFNRDISWMAAKDPITGKTCALIKTPAP